MHGLDFDISLLAGGLVLVSFMMLYQDRLYSLLNVFALHALVLTFPSPGRPMSRMRPISISRRQSRSSSRRSSFLWRCTASSSSSAFIATSSRSSVSAPPCSPGWGWSPSPWS